MKTITRPKTILEMESGPHWFWFTGWQGFDSGDVALPDVQDELLAAWRVMGAMQKRKFSLNMKPGLRINKE